MRHRNKTKKLSRPADHRNAMLRNIITSLFTHKKVKTTLPRAKAARQIAERLISYSISGTLEDKRRIIAYLKDRDTAHELIRLGKEKFAEKETRGGYVSIYHAGVRKGDGAPMAVMQLLVEMEKKKKLKKKKAEQKSEEVIKIGEKTKEKQPVEAIETIKVPEDITGEVDKEEKNNE